MALVRAAMGASRDHGACPFWLVVYRWWVASKIDRPRWRSVFAQFIPAHASSSSATVVTPFMAALLNCCNVAFGRMMNAWVHGCTDECMRASRANEIQVAQVVGVQMRCHAVVAVVVAVVMVVVVVVVAMVVIVVVLVEMKHSTVWPHLDEPTRDQKGTLLPR